MSYTAIIINTHFKLKFTLLSPAIDVIYQDLWR
jgi:hypothetical protein